MPRAKQNRQQDGPQSRPKGRPQSRPQSGPKGRSQSRPQARQAGKPDGRSQSRPRPQDRQQDRLQSRYATQASACAQTVSTVLRDAFGQGYPADRSLAAILRGNHQFGSRDRRLFSETTFAVLRWWGWLSKLVPDDREISPEKWAADAPPEALARILLGAHLLESASLPAVCSIWASWADIALPKISKLAANPKPEDRLQRLKFVFRDDALPRLRQADLIPAWCRRELGDGAASADLVAWLQRRPPVWLRAQTENVNGLVSLLAKEEISVRAHARMSDALYTEPTSVNLRLTSGFEKGLFEVQDLASQTVGHICAPAPGERWWDACAGAGGKTLHLAWLMDGKGSIVASDIRAHKLDVLRKRARRAQYPNIRYREWKGKSLPDKRGGFDGVLVDSPCTCSGTWRRNPDGRWRVTADEISEFAVLQGEILTNAASAVRPGGVLVYATCSMFRRENNTVISDFLKKNPVFSLEPFANPMTGETVDGMLQIWPGDGDCDAMFVARMRKAEKSG